MTDEDKDELIASLRQAVSDLTDRVEDLEAALEETYVRGYVAERDAHAAQAAERYTGRDAWWDAAQAAWWAVHEAQLRKMLAGAV
jgi:hypothetical protein